MTSNDVSELIAAVTSWDGSFTRDGIGDAPVRTRIEAGEPIMIVGGTAMRCLPGVTMRGIAMNDADPWQYVTVQYLRLKDPQMAMPSPLDENRVREIIREQINFDNETRARLTGVVLSALEEQKQADEVFNASLARPAFVTAPGIRKFA